MAEKRSSSSSSSEIEFNHDRMIAFQFPETELSYTERDAALYALGVGACGRDAVDDSELKYVYHQHGQQFIKVLPTFPALFSLGSLPNIAVLPGLKFDPRLLLHGQQYIEIYKPLPSTACVMFFEGLILGYSWVSIKNQVSIAGLHDKGKAAIIEFETKSYQKESGELLCINRSTAFLRGAGGFSRSSKPYSYSKYPTNPTPVVKIPQSAPFKTYEDYIQPSQALLYRLSGDYNPLHSDPGFAKAAGFSQPILHGLCTLGFAVRAIVKCICNGDSDMVRSISCRFLLHVYPGESLITEMWLQNSRVVYQTKVKERNKPVLSGHVDLKHITSPL